MRAEIIHEIVPRQTQVVPEQDRFVIPRETLIAILEESLSTEVGPHDQVDVYFTSPEERERMNDADRLNEDYHTNLDDHIPPSEEQLRAREQDRVRFLIRRDGLHVVIRRLGP